MRGGDFPQTIRAMQRNERAAGTGRGWRPVVPASAESRRVYTYLEGMACPRKLNAHRA